MELAVISSGSMTPTIDTKTMLTVSAAARLLKITRAAVYKAIERERLEIVEIGGVIFINRSALSKYRKNKSVGGRPKKHIKN